MPDTVAFLFDLDGTLVDSVYNHVRAWHVALREQGLELSVWRVHRKIGMSGGLFTAQLQRELGRPIDEAGLKRLRDRHAELFRDLSKDVPPLPGAVDLLKELTKQGLPWAIATSGRMRTAEMNLKSLEVDPKKATVITRDMVRYAKPDPDLFVEAARRLAPPPTAPTSSATASGTCMPRSAAARSASASCRAATARTSSNAPVRCACSTIPPTC